MSEQERIEAWIEYQQVKRTLAPLLERATRRGWRGMRVSVETLSGLQDRLTRIMERVEPVR